MFKSNSRFSENRPKYDDRPKYDSNIFSKKISDKALERERESKEIKIAKALAIENFHELVSVKKKVTPVQSSSFLEKTKPKQIKERASRNKARALMIKIHGKTACNNMHIDHIDHNPLNNNINNLRILRPSENMADNRRRK